MAWNQRQPIFVYAINLNKWQVFWRKLKSFIKGNGFKFELFLRR